MKIFIDINHPAHVHYFKNFIKIMEEKGHTFIVINRNSKIINNLLDIYQINHKIRNKRSTKKSFWHTIIYLFGIILACIKESIKNRPDIYLGFGSFPCTFTAFLFQKPVILLDDTEHNNISHLLNKPFNPIVLTPFYYKKRLGKNQIYFQAYVEQLYLHPQFYNEQKELPQIIKNCNYALVRYIAYDASHDRNIKPITEKVKKQVVKELSKKMRVIVSLEQDTIDEFYKSFQLNNSPDKMHDIIAHSSLFITEGATMASEAGVLGVPYIYINPLQVGNINEQIKSYPKIASQTLNSEQLFEILNEKVNQPIESATKADIRKSIEKTTINPTNFLVWFVENYPSSFKTMKNNPLYQYNFK